MNNYVLGFPVLKEAVPNGGSKGFNQVNSLYL
jgi:hypothetical protein